jgi:hypothetical protein
LAGVKPEFVQGSGGLNGFSWAEIVRVIVHCCVRQSKEFFENAVDCERRWCANLPMERGL